MAPACPVATLFRLVTHLGTIEYGPGHTATVRFELPDEVQFESLATRLRSSQLVPIACSGAPR
jgi:hypothetical protein